MVTSIDIEKCVKKLSYVVETDKYVNNMFYKPKNNDLHAFF
jgi:hypothetical protein